MLACLRCSITQLPVRRVLPERTRPSFAARRQLDRVRRDRCSYSMLEQSGPPYAFVYRDKSTRPCCHVLLLQVHVSKSSFLVCASSMRIPPASACKVPHARTEIHDLTTCITVASYVIQCGMILVYLSVYSIMALCLDLPLLLHKARWRSMTQTRTAGCKRCCKRASKHVSIPCKRASKHMSILGGVRDATAPCIGHVYQRRVFTVTA